MATGQPYAYGALELYEIDISFAKHSTRPKKKHMYVLLSYRVRVTFIITAKKRSPCIEKRNTLSSLEKKDEIIMMKKRTIVSVHPSSVHLELPEDCDTFEDRRLRNEKHQLNHSATR